jgi:hypothetical protein
VSAATLDERLQAVADGVVSDVFVGAGQAHLEGKLSPIWMPSALRFDASTASAHPDLPNERFWNVVLVPT